MELKQTASLRLEQKLVMTPQLQQAIRLLQLSRFELVEEVRREIDSNPLVSSDESDGRAPTGSSDRSAATEQTAERDYNRLIEASAPARVDEKAVREVDWEKFLENRTLQQSSGASRAGFEELPPIEQNLTKPRSLQDHLLWQLQMSDFTDEERSFAEEVIGNLDERGYLDLSGVERPDGLRTPDLSIEDLALDSGLHPDDAPLVLEIMQSFDPLGVASRDLRECLLIQGKAFGYDEVELSIIDRHLQNLEKHNYQAIARDLKITLEDVYDAAKEIQKLESRPAREFFDQDERSIGITPDVYVVRRSDVTESDPADHHELLGAEDKRGLSREQEEYLAELTDTTKHWAVVDNDKGLERLFINPQMLKRMEGDPKAKQFVEEKLRSATWLIRAIDQRRRTIIRVVYCIIAMQRDFFERGSSFLRPMILRDVAAKLGMHESTISRVTTGKYVHTPQGLFELKYFFNSSIQRVSAGEDNIASESVKQGIKKLIDDEDKLDPLSDQAIVELLQAREGIRIARRTVAKYREMLGILASSKRKRPF